MTQVMLVIVTKMACDKLSDPVIKWYRPSKYKLFYFFYVASMFHCTHIIISVMKLVGQFL